jgi:hypothetical protein
MVELDFKVFLNEMNENMYSLIKQMLKEEHFVNDYHTQLSRFADYHVLECQLYIKNENLNSPAIWTMLIAFWNNLRSELRKSDNPALQIVVGREYPNEKYLYHRNGLWLSIEEQQLKGLQRWFLEFGSKQINQHWLFLPFQEEAQSDETEYELCLPGERVKIIATRINGSRQRESVPVSLRVRLAEGYRITDYISIAYGDIVESFPNLGGANVVLTTLLQMNDKMPLVNTYSERLTKPENLNLYSLSAMNLSLVEERDETNIAVLVSSGKIIIDEIRLGG